MKYYSAIKKNTFELVLMRWMKLEPVIQSEVSQKEKHQYSHEIKRHLLLGRKAMTNQDNILKSRDITLPTKVRLVKAMVFPVVMYGCGEGNGTPLQYSCLENPTDGRAW